MEVYVKTGIRWEDFVDGYVGVYVEGYVEMYVGMFIMGCWGCCIEGGFTWEISSDESFLVVIGLCCQVEKRAES